MTDISGLSEFVDDLDELQDSLEDIADELDDAVDRGTRTTALSIEATASRLAPVRSGELRADIKATRLALAFYSIGTTKDYAPSMEYGSRPHPITPNGPYPLRFQIDGEWIATYHVNHPGTEAQPFMRPALRQHRSELVDNIQEEIDKVIDSEL